MHEKFLHEGSEGFCHTPSIVLYRALLWPFHGRIATKEHKRSQKKSSIPASLFRGVHDRILLPARKAGLSGRFDDGFPDSPLRFLRFLLLNHSLSRPAPGKEDA
jgi:hypothetical protein